ncbi:acyl-CoA thioesterase [Paeniglutamicibacter sp. ABSL32-1]|uniref:acyl-CoA thioesterase n=1 Tax=Paeniglutamicibacter quisquiliarum TaxID=2849498 RepID=UPI001C2DE5F6|nr:thioesterase family protein [Paeniglutamicibacter quisquiliarum]MBV1778933.1 acyl-CoA thioesterase [Paeniglutamicibacter quisquiliarum]
MHATEYEVRVPVRWSDQDINGHVNNATIVTLIEESRIQWLNRDAEAQGLVLFAGPKVVVSLNVDYTNSVTSKTDLSVSISTEKIGETSFTLRYRGMQNGLEVFRARTVLVALDPETQKPRPISAGEAAYLQSRLVPAG